MNLPRTLPARQRGAALIVGLMLLVLLTLLAVVAMRQSIVQERMAGGLRNTVMALGGAESAMREAERMLFDFPLKNNGAALVGDVAASQGVYDRGSTIVSAFRAGSDAEFYDISGVEVANYDFDASTNKTAALARQPIYVVQDLGRMRPPGAGSAGEGGSTGTEGYEGSGGGSPAGNADVRVYRVVARSTGGLESVYRTTESYYSGRAK